MKPTVIYLDNHINSRNLITWGRVKLDAMHERPLHSQKCHGDYGPSWIEESNNAVPVNQERYRQTIADLYEILNRRSGLQVENQWLMQDGRRSSLL